MRKILLILLILTLPALLLAEEPVREWKTKSGQTFIEASLDVTKKSDDPEKVYLLKEGKRYKVPFKNISKADQDYVTEFRKGEKSLEKDVEPEQNDATEERSIVVVPAENRYALLIGVNEYAKPIKPLQFCVNDMNHLADCLERSGVPKENITLMTDESPVDHRPTGANIRQQIEVLTELLDPNDQLIVAFSGHGAMVDGKSYLCPSDSNLNDLTSVISRDWAFNQLEKCKAKQKIFVIDACRDEVSFGDQRALGGAKTLEDPIGAYTHGFILIASCDKNQKSWEHPGLKHGVFTYFLAEGIAGASKDDDGYVSVLNLFQFASSKTKKYVYREFSKLQVPTFRLGGEMSDFVIAKLEPGPYSHYIAGDRQIFKINDVEFAFRWCPPGTFTMGSPETEDGREISEQQRQVTFKNGFWMMETEVSQKQWKAVMGVNPSKHEGDDLPVENITWYDCVEFCRKCKSLGFPFQIPTEAQWEYACRAGSTEKFAENLSEVAWYSINSNLRIHPVGQKKPNDWGLHDMPGNVAEMCADYWNLVDPGGMLSNMAFKRYRACRGGSGGSYAQQCRSAFNGPIHPGTDSIFIGVRFVIVQPVFEKP